MLLAAALARPLHEGVRLTLPKGLAPLLEEVVSDRFWAHVKTAQTGSKQAQNGPKGQFDPPEGSGTTSEIFRFAPFLGSIWPLVVGWRLMAVVGWRLVTVGGCRLAVGRCRVGNGGTPSAR